jgi:hypothetical protein
VAMRFNPPPGWPAMPEGFRPPPGWRPDPLWPSAPLGWQLWVDDGRPSADAWSSGLAPSPVFAQPQGSVFTPAPAGYGATRHGSPMHERTGGFSGWAVASFVLGLLGSGLLLSYACGAIALRRIGRLGQKGRGLAIAGMVLSTGWVGLLIAGAVISVGAASRSPSTGKITQQGSLSVFSLRPGDCFANPANASQFASVTAIPCAQKHNAQVYATFGLPGILSYPGQAKADSLAQAGCKSRVGSIDRTKTTGSLSVRFIVPDQTAWTDGQRIISCLVLSPTPLTSSVVKPQ